MSLHAPIVVVTDLDGTLLDHDTYEPGPAAERVTALTSAGVSVVPCSAKTHAEQDVHRRELGLDGLFVVENGAAVHDDGGPVEVLGLAYDEVRDRLRRAAADLGVSVRGFADMDVDEVADRTGLATEAAERARDRAYTEPFVIDGDGDGDGEPDADALRAALADVGLGLQRGARFWTASGHHDKGDAVAVVRELVTVERHERPLIYALGDTHNDAAMLAAADVAMLVQRPGGTWDDVDVPHLTRIEGVGPVGWAEAADGILAAVGAK